MDVKVLEGGPATEAVLAPEKPKLGITRVTLPDGRTIDLAMPRIATAFVLAKILPPDSSTSYAIAKYLFYVRAIDGVPVSQPTSFAELQNLANVIGDQYVDAVAAAAMSKWPPLEVKDLPLSEV